MTPFIRRGTQALSRSWNRVYANVVFEYENLYLSLKPWYRIPERAKSSPLEPGGDDNGKYVMPSPLEERLQISPYIAGVMLYGDGRPFNIALVVPEAAAIKELLDTEGVAPEDRDPRVRTLIHDELEIHSRGFKSFEAPKRFVLLPHDFSVEDDTLTPSFKLKRRNVVARYRDLIEALYVEAAAPPPTAGPPSEAAAAGL